MSKADLVKNLGEVVKVNFSLLPDLSLTSSLFKGAKKVYDLARMKKYVNKSRETVIKLEESCLKSFEIDLGNLTLSDCDQDRHHAYDGDQHGCGENLGPIAKKRKNFEDLTSRTVKCARVKSVVEHLESDKGLEPKVLDKVRI